MAKDAGESCPIHLYGDKIIVDLERDLQLFTSSPEAKMMTVDERSECIAKMFVEAVRRFPEQDARSIAKDLVHMMDEISASS